MQTDIDDDLSSDLVQAGYDSAEERATVELRQFFIEHSTEVFFTRQIEVRFEDRYYHWITNRAIHRLVEDRVIESVRGTLVGGAEMVMFWNRKWRYPKRAAKAVLELVNEYSAPHIGEILGLQGEQMVHAGFSRIRFLYLGEKVRQIEERIWFESGHDLDFAFERDGRRYGIEVKNTLGYIKHEEMVIKVNLAKALGLTPVFVVRMMPKSWIWEVKQAGGFVLVLKYQLYPWTERALATRVRETLGLPVDSPKRLYEATMKRFEEWHVRSVNW